MCTHTWEVIGFSDIHQTNHHTQLARQIERERVSLPFILTEPDCGEVSPAELSDHMISSIVDIADVDDVVAPSAVIARVLLLFLVTAEHITLVVGV